MSNAEKIPIIVLTGFLGSGKTVLLNALLKQPDFADSAIIVNEFGEVGLDHLLVASAVENIVLLDAGCLCCAVLGSLIVFPIVYKRLLAGGILSLKLELCALPAGFVGYFLGWLVLRAFN